MAFRDALDSKFGLVTGTTLHTVGAIGLVAALVATLYWIRTGRGKTWAFALTYTSAAANLLGGAMRTWLPAHPGLEALGSDSWVQLMLLKHVFIFVAIGIQIWFVHTAMRPRTRSGIGIPVFLISLAILNASILGGYAQITPIGGEEPERDDVEEQATGPRELFANATGVLTTTPIAPATATGTFDMPVVQHARANFIGDGLTLALTAPDGGTHGPGDLPMQPGTWAYEVSGTFALQTDWSLSVQMTQSETGNGYLAETVTVPGAQFFEINTLMPENGTFCWDWTSSADVVFDVHSHFDGEVQYLVQYTASDGRGCFTNQREGGYSLLWDNQGAAPVSLTYTVQGDFEVDSYFPPRGT